MFLSLHLWDKNSKHCNEFLLLTLLVRTGLSVSQKVGWQLLPILYTSNERNPSAIRRRYKCEWIYNWICISPSYKIPLDFRNMLYFHSFWIYIEKTLLATSQFFPQPPFLFSCLWCLPTILVTCMYSSLFYTIFVENISTMMNKSWK